MARKILSFTLLIIALALPQGIQAQINVTNTVREKWLQEVRQVKRNFFIKELNLTKEQQTKFFPLYEEMEDQNFKIDEEARQMAQRVADADNTNETEYVKAAEAQLDADVRTATLRREYMDKFKTILSGKQLFELKNAERKFSREMMRQHHRLRSEGKNRRNDNK